MRPLGGDSNKVQVLVEGLVVLLASKMAPLRTRLLVAETNKDSRHRLVVALAMGLLRIRPRISTMPLSPMQPRVLVVVLVGRHRQEEQVEPVVSTVCWRLFPLPICRHLPLLKDM